VASVCKQQFRTEHSTPLAANKQQFNRMTLKPVQRNCTLVTGGLYQETGSDVAGCNGQLAGRMEQNGSCVHLDVTSALLQVELSDQSCLTKAV
jgi:hypothetical protein